jgi:DNA-binding NarL/FixJ family response regulator
MRLVIADDSVLLREGVVRVAEAAGHEVVAQAAELDELLRKVRAHRPDVAVIDIRMPPTQGDEGLRAAGTIQEELPDVGILVLSHYVEESYAVRLLSNGAEGVGYLLKDRVGEVKVFTEALQRVADGGSALDPEVVSLMMGRRARDDPFQELTPREREVMALMAEGLSNKAIAAELFVTDRAVERHVTGIFNKLGLQVGDEHHRRVLAVITYLKA